MIPRMSVNLHWDAPPSLTPGNVVQSAFHIPMIPFEDSGNTAAGFENNYDDCNPTSESPDVVYKYEATADISVSISTCYSSFDTKVYVFENTDFFLFVVVLSDAITINFLIKSTT